MREITPTRTAAMELKEERRAMREGYEFLDEKRLLLAAEMLRELKRYEQDRAALLEALARAASALQAACARHGLQGVQVYPAARLENARLQVIPRRLLGMRLQEARLEADAASASPALHPSPEAEHCRGAFLEVARRSAGLAAIAGNLERLRREYRRTERRARALEDVLMPEIEQALYEIESRLEEMEQEEAVRLRRG
ncbi:MAG: V-type ATP synthase subunit D [Pseudomonadota bacterium]